MLDMLCTKINRQNLYIVIPPLTSLPKSGAGKILRRLVQEKYSED